MENIKAKFIKEIQAKTNIKPHYEIIKDAGGIGWNWRNNKGSVSVIFYKDKSFTWASYFENQDTSSVGRFYPNDEIPDGLINALKQLEARNETTKNK